MWGSIVGFGQYHYKYASGREGDTAAAGFAARKAATTVYVVDGVGAHVELLEPASCDGGMELPRFADAFEVVSAAALE